MSVKAKIDAVTESGETPATIDVPAGEDQSGGRESKPGDPGYDWSPHYPEGVELFQFAYPDGTVVAIRKFADIYSKQFLRKIKHLQSEFDIESAAVDRATCPLARTIIDSAPDDIDGPDLFQQLWSAWTKVADEEPLNSGN